MDITLRSNGWYWNSIAHGKKKSHLTEVHRIYLGLHMLGEVSCDCVSVFLILSLLSVQPLCDHKLSNYICTIRITERNDLIKYNQKK